MTGQDHPGQAGPGALVLLGATGDLAGRFLLPALAGLLADGRLPADLRVVGAGPQPWDDETFRSTVGERLAGHAGHVPEPDRQALLGRLRYAPLDLDDPAGVRPALRRAGEGRVVVYLALPPALFPAALRALGEAGLAPGSRVAVEKPFGEDLASAVALDAQLAQVAPGDAAYRVDHVLGMPTARALPGLRAPGSALAAVWDAAHLEQVDVLWEETLALEGRADFFDRTGAVRDVVQNHVLQLLALVAAEPPEDDGEQALHTSRLALLEAVRPPADVAARTRRGRWAAGRLVGTGTPVPDYAHEDGVEPARGTETSAELVLEVDTPRWQGTRFVLRAGKALAADRKGVQLHPRPGVALPGAGGPGRALWVELDAAEHAGQPRGELLAYAAVLADLLSGGTALSVSAQEAEQSWRVVGPVLERWAAGTPPLLDYPAGSAGPPSVPGVLRTP